MRGQLHALTALPQGEGGPGTHYIQVWVGPRDNLNVAMKEKIPALPGIEP